MSESPRAEFARLYAEQETLCDAECIDYLPEHRQRGAEIERRMVELMPIVEALSQDAARKAVPRRVNALLQHEDGRGGVVRKVRGQDRYIYSWGENGDADRELTGDELESFEDELREELGDGD